MSIFFLAQSAAGMNSTFMIVAVIAIFISFYFSMIKPQKKQQQEWMKVMSGLKKGDQVIMIDGLHGRADSVNDAGRTVVVDADGIFLTFERMAIRRVFPTTAAPAEGVEANGAKEEKVEIEEGPTEDSKLEETASNKIDDTNSEGE